MKALGRHILAEFFGCDSEILNDVGTVESILVDAALTAGAEVREVAFHRFSPQGVSGMVIISESHLAIHTWPELGYAAVDVFTCGDEVDPWDAYNYIVSAFGADKVTATDVYKRQGYTAAVIGCADTDTWERPLVNMFMDRSGSVPHGYLGPELLARDPSGPFGHWTSTEKVLAAVQRYKERVHIIAVEWADLYRVEKYAPYCEPAAAASMRAEALKRLDQFTALLLAEFSPSESLIMIISPSSKVEGSARVQGLTPIAVWGPDMGSGYLVSPTTRRPGLVANIDVPASILAYFRLPVSNSIIGRPISLVPAQKKLEGLTSLEVRATYSYVQRPLMLRLFIGYLIATLALSILATLLHRRLLKMCIRDRGAEKYGQRRGRNVVFGARRGST